MPEDATRTKAPDPIAVSAPRGRRLPQLDGLRGLAAISVMLYHVHNLFGLTLGFERAYLFVDVFFMLSGFVLTPAWSADLARHSTVPALFKARLRRLWPTIVAACLLGAAIHAIVVETQHLPLFLLLGLLVVPAIWRDGSIFPLNGPQWSLFWELVANLAHLLWLRRLRERGLLAVCVVTGLSTIAAIGWCGADTFGPDGDHWWLALPRVGWSYAIGMLIAHFYQTADWRPILSWWQALALPMFAVLILPRLPLSIAAGDALLVILVFPPLFWLLATAHRPATASRWLSRLGALSFPLYAVHLPLLTLFVTFDMPRAASAAMATTASLVLAIGLGHVGDRVHKRRAPDALLIRAENAA